MPPPMMSMMRFGVMGSKSPNQHVERVDDHIMPGFQIGDRALQPFDGNGEEEMRGHHQRLAVHREQRVEPRYRFDFGERHERNDDPRSEMVQYVRLAIEQQAATGSARIATRPQSEESRVGKKGVRMCTSG